MEALVTSSPKLTDNGVCFTACPHDCPDCCSIISHIQNGKLVKIEGNPAHPVTQGIICRKFSRSPARVYASDRLLYPLKRVGPKGEGSFRRISWEEAIGHIARQWKNIISEYGPESILPFFGSGTEGLVNGRIAGKRFFNRMGTLQLDRTICTKGGRTGFRYTMGTSMGADPCHITDNRLIIAWGTNSTSTNIHHQIFLKKALDNGAIHAVINPVKVKGAESAEYVLQPRPGSDAALALGMMHTIIDEKLYDDGFIKDFTYGFDQLKKRIQDYPPERVATLTDINANDIRNFARVYASNKPSFIYVGPGCQRHTNSGMTLRTIACLPALIGAWRYQGSGMYFPTSTIFPVDLTPLEGEQLRPNPPVKYNMIKLGQLLNDRTFNIRSLYVFNGNPAAVLFDQNCLRSRLKQDDLFTIVHEQYLTDTARFADIILPATTQFEHMDLLFSYYHFSVMLNCQAIKPLGECRSNLDTFRLLADAMGFGDPCFKQSSQDIIQEILNLDHPCLKGITLEYLSQHGWCPAKLNAAHEFVREGRFPTPSGLIEFYSQQMKDCGLDPLPAYIPLRESMEQTPDLYRRYPLYFITSSAHSTLNSNYAQHVNNHNGKARPTLHVNPIDAERRGITNGALVRVFNNRGSCRLWAEVTDKVRPGVVASAGLWWDRQFPDGNNANHTTPDYLSDIGEGSAFNSNLVELEYCNETS